eukprot:5893308-Heterocapsa_arctica.AAC.1
MEFARALFAMNPHFMRKPGDLRAWEWARQMVLADEAGPPGPGSIDQVLGAPLVDDLGFHDARTWGPATLREIRDDLGHTWGPVSVDSGTCTYYNIFDDEDQNVLPT